MVVFILLIFLMFASPVHASRITIETDTTTGTVGEGGVSVKVKLLQADSSDSGNSFRENAELKIRSPRDGDRCDTILGGSDVNGYVFGTCYATTTGSYSIFAHSNDRGDDSPEVSLTFNEAPHKDEPTPTEDPTVTDKPTATSSAADKKKKAAQQVKQPGATQQNPFMQDGLAPYEEPADTGLAPVEDGQVEGAVDASQVGKGAPDLLKSLIFLTGALVLLIWSGYLIILQIQLRRGKKDPLQEHR